MSVLGWVGGCRVFIIIITFQNFELSWQNGLKERLHLTESLFLMKNSNADTVYKKLFSLCFFVSVFNYSLLPNNFCILSDF